MKCDFVVGQKLVCVTYDDSPVEGLTVVSEGFVQPEIGRIYTVRELFISKTTGQLGMKLEEIPDQRVTVLYHGLIGSATIAWDPNNFRPLKARKTDISIFTKLLNPTSKEVEHA